MSMTNAELVESFINGAQSGQSANMSIEQGPLSYEGVVVDSGGTALVGYGWAVYAVRTENGRVNINWGWHDWAQEKRQEQGKGGNTTTERHMKLVDQKSSPHAIMTSRRRQCEDEPASASRIAETAKRGRMYP